MKIGRCFGQCGRALSILSDILKIEEGGEEKKKRKKENKGRKKMENGREEKEDDKLWRTNIERKRVAKTGRDGFSWQRFRLQGQDSVEDSRGATGAHSI